MFWVCMAPLLASEVQPSSCVLSGMYVRLENPSSLANALLWTCPVLGAAIRQHPLCVTAPVLLCTLVVSSPIKVMASQEVSLGGAASLLLATAGSLCAIKDALQHL
ncbi:hypothetical protein O6P43_026906 [Quillaja saponaria]|uniref:Uncharacterized protein n=1 Tax=Quillaja saponaria TaxID=32244 RepID=A0AAD7L4Z8_QUISA|nr:hypothetical protein O6P43_026906 [Quillaja saponaria]